MQYREPELEQYRQVWLIKKCHGILRRQKKEQKISMAKILNELILEKYGYNEKKRME